MPRLNFVVARDGWHFPNSFRNRILPGVLNGVTTNGLCGGMVMSALDYWRRGVSMPAHYPDDFPVDEFGARLPGEASRLRQYIYDRQVNSLLTSSMFTRWITAPGIGPQAFHDWAVGAEFAVVQRQLALGRPVMLGLWSMAGAPTSGHQVLCYGYDTNPVRIYVYDPNFPDEEAVLTPISAGRGCQMLGTATKRELFYRGYFFTDVYNWAESPPYDPRYRDLVIQQGLSTEPPGPDLSTNGPLNIVAAVRNIGEYLSRFRSLAIWGRDPQGRNIDDVVGGIEPDFRDLRPNTEQLLVRKVPRFAATPGLYFIGVAKESLAGHWQDLTPGPQGTVARKALQVWKSSNLVADTVVDVPESAKKDVSTGVVLNPGDEYALTVSGSIWAGVWFTGLNGPEGWTDRIETNPDSPLHSGPQAHPFSLVGRFEGESYFYIGSELRRQPYSGATPKQLLLRINDNVPANGSGVFQCRIQVWH